MAKVVEGTVVKIIESELSRAGREYYNIHGSSFSKNGTADFITMDSDGVFLAIEAKAPGAEPYVNQWRRAIEVLNSNGRYVVAYDDFDIDVVDDRELPICKIGSEIGLSEFEAKLEDRTHTVEIVTA